MYFNLIEQDAKAEGREEERQKTVQALLERDDAISERDDAIEENKRLKELLTKNRIKFD